MSDTLAAPSAAPVHASPAAEPAPWVSHLGDPFSLGLASFGVSALVLASVMSGLIDATSTPAVLSLALAFGFFIELIAGVLHFMRGETFPGFVFTAYAGFWLSYALLVQFYVPQVVAAKGDPAPVVGMFLLAWGIFTTYMLLAAVRTTKTVLGIFLLLTAVFYLAAIGTFTGSSAISQLSGWVLVLDAVLALYLSASTIVNATWDRTVLPAP